MKVICNRADICPNVECHHAVRHRLHENCEISFCTHLQDNTECMEVKCDTCEQNNCALVPNSTLCDNLYTVKKDMINPSHYQSFIKDMQWIETIQYLPHFRNPESFKAALELQVRKYLDRSGGKDEELQETEKALWYLKFLTAFIKNGNKPIKVKDVDNILKKK